MIKLILLLADGFRITLCGAQFVKCNNIYEKSQFCVICIKHEHFGK